jgi:hypothetical protein
MSVAVTICFRSRGLVGLSYAVDPSLPAADSDRLDANELEALRSRPNMLDWLARNRLIGSGVILFREEGD